MNHATGWKEHGEQPRSGHVVVGVDTHKHMHVVAVLDTIGGILATLTIPTDTGGFQQMLDWAGSYGRILAFGVEGPGSRRHPRLVPTPHRHKVVEAGRPERRPRRLNGKSDTLDAENAARAVLAGFATTTSEKRRRRIRDDPPARDRPRPSRRAARSGHGDDEGDARPRPDALRRETTGKTQIALARHLAGLRPRDLNGPEDALRHPCVLSPKDGSTSIPRQKS
ncbi:transposase [Nocardia sp. NPDC051911]|uniref:IS110 family transposase n=1 Tax=Nocardia sp. NPDC051911 TaxID=3154648 RepID=UPI0034457D15